MSQPRKRQPRRPTEYEDLARSEGWDAGFNKGYDVGYAQAMYDRGHEDGYEAGFADASCRAYEAGFKDAKAGRPPAHTPHTIPDDASELIDPDSHE